MANDITGIGKTISPETGNRTAAETRREADLPSAGGTTTGRADSQELTGASRLLQRLSSEISDSDPVDRGRVEAILAEIDTGRFSFDADEAASRLLGIERLFESN